MPARALTPVQWRFEKLRDGPGWVIQNVGTGKFLSLTEGAHDGLNVVGSSDPMQWDVRRDEQDPSVYRCVLPCEACEATLMTCAGSSA